MHIGLGDINLLVFFEITFHFKQSLLIQLLALNVLLGGHF